MDDYRGYLVEPLRDLILVFDDLKIPHALMGGMAVSVHGIPRPTHDLDFTIALARERLPELYLHLQKGAIRFLISMNRDGWIKSQKCHSFESASGCLGK